MAKGLNIFDETFDLELPEGSTMDEYLDKILPQIRPMSEDLYELIPKIQGKKVIRWKEVRDTDDFHESVLHLFLAEGEYLQSNQGNISKGVWRHLEGTNTLIIEFLKTHELYDLAFLNQKFFILKKHGNHKVKKYFVLVEEKYAKNREWRDLMDLLFNIYRGNNRFMLWVVVFLVILFILVFLSLF